MWTLAATPLHLAPRRRLCPENAALSNPARPVHRWTIGAIEAM